MSLEKAIEANTAAVLALNETFTKMSAGNAAKTAAIVGTPAAAKPKGNGLTYDDIKVPFLALCKSHGADVGRAVCKQFGHENLKTVKPEQFADVLAAIKTAAAVPAA